MQILFEHLQKGTLIITPNNRLSAILQEDYFAWCQQTVVDQPACLPYNTLIIQAYNHLMTQKPDFSWPRLLTARQVQYLWRDILKSHTTGIYSEGLFNAVFSAFNQCLLWNIDPNDPRFTHTPQTQQFQQWWQIFNQKKQELQAICEQDIVHFLTQNRIFPAENHIIWYCFDSFTPQQKQLQNHLTTLDFTQEWLDLPENSANCYQYKAENPEEEWLQMVHFLEENLTKGEKSIGIVVPDIQQQGNSLQRFLERYISAELFNISLGKPLAAWPLVSHALHFLSMDLEIITHQQAQLLLFSPYLEGGKNELELRMQSMEDSRLLQTPAINFSDWLKELAIQAPNLAIVLNKLSRFPEKASPLQWIDIFKNRLLELGYPGEYGLRSENYQCFHKWMNVLDELAELDSLAHQISKQEALSILKNLANQTIFQPLRAPKPIQILGMLEASGCQFSALWINGLTDQCLPEKVRLSPFIPPIIQKETSMPHSSPEKELAMAQQLLQRFQRSCQTGIFSYAAFQEDKPELPCPLIQHLPHFLPPENPVLPFISPFVQQEETWCLPVEKGQTLRGGTRLLANQALCPFKAFAAHRLHARPTPEVVEGLIPATRGQLIHKVMEIIWSTLKDQETLKNIPEEQLDSEIAKAITTALRLLAPKTLPALIENLEIKRLGKLVKAALDWDKTRDPFTVLALEEPCSITLGDLEINMRIDRLDATASGQKWVIDYKSSLPKPKPWYEDRLQEPQLLLYTLLDTCIEALLYMELKQGKVQISGFSSEKMDLKGMDAPSKDKKWLDFRQTWQDQLQLLATEFLQGHHAPIPLNASVCGECDFANLCRFSPD